MQGYNPIYHQHSQHEAEEALPLSGISLPPQNASLHITVALAFMATPNDEVLIFESYIPITFLG